MRGKPVELIPCLILTRSELRLQRNHELLTATQLGLEASRLSVELVSLNNKSLIGEIGFFFCASAAPIGTANNWLFKYLLF